MLLKNKNILLGVTGSIAIYKSLELIRLYIKAGANVKVIMTNSAKRFITTLSFEAISQNKVLEEATESWDTKEYYNHISVGKWADIFVIAPCSANTINKLANGIADNLLTQSLLAFDGIKLLAPAANTNMIKNSITQKSITILKEHDFKIVNSQIKELACKDIGDGAMAEPIDIYFSTARQLLKESYWSNRDVILSGGGTIEKIDDVRYISNFSSGKMANSLAQALYFKGANVSIVATKGFENLAKEIDIIKVSSSYEMYKNLSEKISKLKKQDKKAYLFMVAAISDYLPEQNNMGKLKKEDLGENWDLKLKQNIDILCTLNKEELISIGFKAETNKQKAFENAKKMLKNKNLDAVCLNIIDEENTFGSNSNNIELIFEEDSYKYKGEKIDISIDILDKLKGKFEVNGK